MVPVTLPADPRDAAPGPARRRRARGGRVPASPARAGELAGPLAAGGRYRGPDPDRFRPRRVPDLRRRQQLGRERTRPAPGRAQRLGGEAHPGAGGRARPVRRVRGEPGRPRPGPRRSPEAGAGRHQRRCAKPVLGGDQHGFRQGYQQGTVDNLNALTDNLNDLPYIRQLVTASSFQTSQVIRVYTGEVIAAANAFSASSGVGVNDADLQGNVVTLGALLRNDVGPAGRPVRGAELARTFGPGDLATLEQASESQSAAQSDFAASTNETELEYLNNTISGSQVDLAEAQETLAEELGNSAPATPLTAHGLTAQGWYGNMQSMIHGARTVADGLVTSITDRANTLRSQATQNLLITSLVTLAAPGPGAIRIHDRGPLADPPAAQAPRRRAGRGRAPAAGDGAQARPAKVPTRTSTSSRSGSPPPTRSVKSRGPSTRFTGRRSARGRRSHAARQPERHVHQPVPAQLSAHRAAAVADRLARAERAGSRPAQQPVPPGPPGHPHAP